MSATEPDRRRRSATLEVEPSSWWPFVALVLGAVGCYGVLAVHLILDATNAGAWGLVWMAVPGIFFCAAAGALLVGSGLPLGERLATIPAALLGYSPQARSERPASSTTREPS